MTRSTVALATTVLLIGGAATLWWPGTGKLTGTSSSPDTGTGDEAPNYPLHSHNLADKKDSRTTSNTKTNNSATTLRKLRSLTDDTQPTHVRLDIARSIDTSLSADAVDFLLSTLNHKPPRHLQEQWWVVLNEIMEQMRKKGVAPDHLADTLTALVADPAQPETVRDYAVQHLSQWIAPPSGGDLAGESSREKISAALNAIADTVTDPSIAHTSIPGTALMALTVNAGHIPAELIAPVWQKLDPAITAMLKGETHGSLSTRTTAIQSVALRGSTTHLPLIRAFARDEKADPSIRLSSIAALGIYRSEPDRAYLNKIAGGTSRYRHAARSALKKFSE